MAALPTRPSFLSNSPPDDEADARNDRFLLICATTPPTVSLDGFILFVSGSVEIISEYLSKVRFARLETFCSRSFIPELITSLSAADPVNNIGGTRPFESAPLEFLIAISAATLTGLRQLVIHEAAPNPVLVTDSFVRSAKLNPASVSIRPLSVRLPPKPAFVNSLSSDFLQNESIFTNRITKNTINKIIKSFLNVQ